MFKAWQDSQYDDFITNLLLLSIMVNNYENELSFGKIVTFLDSLSTMVRFLLCHPVPFHQQIMMLQFFYKHLAVINNK